MYSYQIRKTFKGFSAVTHRPQARNIGFSTSPGSISSLCYPSRRSRRCRPVRRPAVLHAPLPSCRPAARVQLVRQHPPFPRLLCSFSRPRSSFPSGDNRASCAARCSLSDGGFAGDEHPTRVCLPIPFPSHPAARNQTPKSLT